MKVEAKKKFGQNFISDQNLIKKIVSILGDDEDQLIIEIGPGTGALTKLLAQKYNKVVAIEIDTDMEPILKKEVQSDNFELFLSDVLLVDFEKLISEKKQHDNQKVSVISNMPYYITSEILFRTLNVSNMLTKAVFMMQKEVAIRVCSYKGENNYNNLSVACEFFADKKYEFTVPKHMFFPVPKVDSAIISLTFNNKYTDQIEDKDKFLTFLRKIFNNRRKTILNNLSNVTNDKTKANEILDTVRIDKNLRPEVIGLEDFIKMYIQIK
ncbi:16S rRNA (adenine1518-N6/adenine1519-N6)-dimethyltransferase [Mesoplasma entomophilum]|uniref:Ribosomal RNA small subunit methyltransferase A n=1 Tax=Mesoplasma entomophilum TaxID=2149 RepID=A0A3S5XZ89_9MOLU|nr:16S rRNA (adenine(1518)-N(6)/adenine(1519)-N(6))-dimethyltransferase RsmA [Mesoplasma entomophilum]ATQ35170.1 16S rRNA (adenine(1518)-N(6)/adenine(1519)-N(6))-dimethyltransferase [Mesoplasma entomophilum]ATZ19116.1 16S rRNA (adenine1518-N6/adenine1519-N6)-dimethyltransferase [Mesoplasma entomophilum]